MSSRGDQCFSGGVDGTIQSWNTPDPNIDPYDSYGTSCLAPVVFTEEDELMKVSLQSPPSCWGRSAVTRTRSGVWSTAPLIIASSPAPLTEPSDSGAPPTSPRLWRFLTRTEVREHLGPDLTDPSEGPPQELNQVMNPFCCRPAAEPGVVILEDPVWSKPSPLCCRLQVFLQIGFLGLMLCGSVPELGVPTSLDLVRCEPTHMVASFNSGHIGLFNMETQQLLLKLDSAGPPGTTRNSATQIFCSDLQVS